MQKMIFLSSNSWREFEGKMTQMCYVLWLAAEELLKGHLQLSLTWIIVRAETHQEEGGVFFLSYFLTYALVHWPFWFGICFYKTFHLIQVSLDFKHWKRGRESMCLSLILPCPRKRTMICNAITWCFFKQISVECLIYDIHYFRHSGEIEIIS